MKLTEFVIPLIVALAVSACSAVQVTPQAANIEIVTQLPQSVKCVFVGEVVGSQGNWFTGDITSNQNLMVGARNELRNETSKRGGNLVLMQQTANASSWDSLGTTNTTVIGKAYRCTN